MQNETHPVIQTLLDELAKDDYLVPSEAKELVKLLEPYSDIAIPFLIEKLKDQSDNHYISGNALKVLALSTDPRSILPLLRHIEIETGWTNTVFNGLHEGLLEKDGNTHQKVNEQLIRYLEEGPRIPAPKPFDPIATENSFNDFLGALMEASGITELNDETQELASEAKQKWMQPPETTEDEKRKLRDIQAILVNVIETLSRFDGLRDSQLESLLSKYIREYGFASFVTQHALTALSKIGPQLATTHLNELANSSPSQRDPTIKRVVGRKPDSNITSYEFTICIREPNAEEWKERAYYFTYEQGLVFLFARQSIINKWFVGHASNQDMAVQLAIEYLERWNQEVDSLAQIADRYSECLHAVQQFIDFEKWGFRQTYIWQVYDMPYERPQIIYDSQWCRVMLSFRSFGEMYNQSDILSILYGRLHAPNRERTMLWKGEHHHCWHDVSLALCFLDEMSPAEAAKVLGNHPLMAKYRASHSGSQTAVESRAHAAIWEQYGQRLFQLFDLRHPDLWDKYSMFIKQVYEIKGWNKYGHTVPHEKIC